jgi:hypothetical protein
MVNYESPTIEQAGGPGNKVEPQLWIVWFLPIFVIVPVVVFVEGS